MAGLAVLCGALVLVMGAMTSLTVALPDIARSTGASQSDLTWIIDSYTVSFAGFLLPCGALGDRYGRRRMLIAGLVVFGVASALAPIGDDVTVLIVARAFAGLGAALVMPATLSLITTTMSGAAKERAVGLWVATCTLGGALGLVFSGLILEFTDWRGVLYSFAVGAALMVVLARHAPESVDAEQSRFDVLGAVTSAFAIALVVFGIIEAPAHGWGSGFVWTCVAAGVLLALVFAVLQVRRAHPLLDIRIFRSPMVLAGSVLLIGLFGVLFAFFFLSMQYLQFVEGKSGLEAGLTLLPAAATLVPGSLIAPILVARLGFRLVTAGGLLPLVAGLCLMSTLREGDAVLFQVGLMTMGMGFGICITPATVAILGSVPASKQGVASAVNDAVREVGAALGIAVVGSVLATGYSRELGPATDALPEPAREAAHTSIAGALEVGAQLGPAAAPAVAEARDAFLSGFRAPTSRARSSPPWARW